MLPLRMLSPNRHDFVCFGQAKQPQIGLQPSWLTKIRLCLPPSHAAARLSYGMIQPPIGLRFIEYGAYTSYTQGYTQEGQLRGTEKEIVIDTNRGRRR